MSGSVFTGEIEDDEQDIKVTPFIPDSSVLSEIEGRAARWASSFGISILDLRVSGARWYPGRDQLLFSFRDSQGNTLLQQGRNFNPFYKSKYQTYGNPNEVEPIYRCKNPTTTLVIVEDCLSAIKIARQCDSMPILSSTLARDKLKRLARLYGAFLIWLDGNMYHKAQQIAERLQMCGAKATAIYTPLDPKCYEDDFICNILLTNRV